MRAFFTTKIYNYLYTDFALTFWKTSIKKYSEKIKMKNVPRYFKILLFCYSFKYIQGKVCVSHHSLDGTSVIFLVLLLLYLCVTHTTIGINIHSHRIYILDTIYIFTYTHLQSMIHTRIHGACPNQLNIFKFYIMSRVLFALFSPVLLSMLM